MENYEIIGKFDVQGYFYKHDNLIFRRFLEIKKKTIDIKENDLSMIMMNPGSSKPKNIIDENDIKSWDGYLDKFVEAQPDETQIQIMKIMENCKFNYAKIINLSDIRIAKSDFFYLMLEKCLSGNCLLGNCSKKYDHSIFSEKNRRFLENYLSAKSIFILAWGVDKILNDLSKQALTVLEEMYGKNIKKIGNRHEKIKNGYYHPFPPRESEQIKWFNEISNKIKEKIYL